MTQLMLFFCNFLLKSFCISIILRIFALEFRNYLFLLYYNLKLKL